MSRNPSPPSKPVRVPAELIPLIEARRLAPGETLTEVMRRLLAPVLVSGPRDGSGAA